MGTTLSTLITRAAQISYSLNSFAGFDSYYTEIRQELLLPGMFARNWNEFSSWANSATTYLIVFWVLQSVGGYVGSVGKIVDLFGQFLVPIFGVNLARLNYIILGLFGISLSNTAAQGGFDYYRANILNQFFASGSMKPGVATYGDVVDSYSAANQKIAQLAITAVQMVVVYFGFRYSGVAFEKFMIWRANRAQAMLIPQVQALGLNENSILSRDAIITATSEAVAKGNSELNPLIRELRITNARQARAQLEKTIANETLKWSRFDERFAETARRLGLDGKSGNWKDLSALANAWGRLKNSYEAGQVSSFEYQELTQSITDMYRTLSPVYAEMGKSTLFRNFFERVWESTTGASQAQLSANAAYFKSLTIGGDFIQAMRGVYSDSVTRPGAAAPDLSLSATKAIDRIALELEKNPDQARSRIEGILRDFRQKDSK